MNSLQRLRVWRPSLVHGLFLQSLFTTSRTRSYLTWCCLTVSSPLWWTGNFDSVQSMGTHIITVPTYIRSYISTSRLTSICLAEASKIATRWIWDESSCYLVDHRRSCMILLLTQLWPQHHQEWWCIFSVFMAFWIHSYAILRPMVINFHHVSSIFQGDDVANLRHISLLGGHWSLVRVTAGQFGLRCALPRCRRRRRVAPERSGDAAHGRRGSSGGRDGAETWLGKNMKKWQTKIHFLGKCWILIWLVNGCSVQNDQTEKWGESSKTIFW